MRRILYSTMVICLLMALTGLPAYGYGGGGGGGGGGSGDGSVGTGDPFSRHGPKHQRRQHCTGRLYTHRYGSAVPGPAAGVVQRR